MSLAVGTDAIASIVACNPRWHSTRDPFGEICTPAPISRKSAACSYSATSNPRCSRASAATMPPMPAPAIRTRGLPKSPPPCDGSTQPGTRIGCKREIEMLNELPLRLHHHAYAVKDQEVNRHFIEDILGIPLVATWCERTFRPEVGREVDYCHTFYEVGDGGALAFFQFADEEAWEKNRAILQDVGGSWHVAFKVTQATFDELMRR